MKTWGHVLFWEEQGNAPQDFGRDDFMLKGYAQCVICMKQQQKKACDEHSKTHDKGSVDMESLVEF